MFENLYPRLVRIICSRYPDGDFAGEQSVKMFYALERRLEREERRIDSQTTGEVLALATSAVRNGWLNRDWFRFLRDAGTGGDESTPPVDGVCYGEGRPEPDVLDDALACFVALVERHFQCGVIWGKRNPNNHPPYYFILDWFEIAQLQTAAAISDGEQALYERATEVGTRRQHNHRGKGEIRERLIGRGHDPMVIQ